MSLRSAAESPALHALRLNGPTRKSQPSSITSGTRGGLPCASRSGSPTLPQDAWLVVEATILAAGRCRPLAGFPGQRVGRFRRAAAGAAAGGEPHLRSKPGRLMRR